MEGFVAPGFERVAEKFDSATKAAGEDGAAMAMTVEGEVVVDVWRGEWAEDSLVCIYSATKGMTALCVQLLVDRGLLDVDAPVTRYWPEFGANGKESTLVRHVLNHTAGIFTFPRYWEVLGPDCAGLADHDLVATHLAAAAPAWPPGTAFGYHAHTFGYVLGELVRRVDGRTLGAYFAEEVAKPLGLDLYIGLPDELAGRVVPTAPPRQQGDASVYAGASDDLRAGGPTSPEAWAYASLFVPLDTADPAPFLAELMNRPYIRRAELPSGNAIGDARSLARMYAPLALGGAGLVSAERIAQFTEAQTTGGVPTGSGLGYGLFGPDGRQFGHTGAGGNVGLADPDRRRSYAYVKSRMLYDAEVIWKPLHAN